MARPLLLLPVHDNVEVGNFGNITCLKCSRRSFPVWATSLHSTKNPNHHLLQFHRQSSISGTDSFVWIWIPREHPALDRRGNHSWVFRALICFVRSIVCCSGPFPPKSIPQTSPYGCQLDKKGARGIYVRIGRILQQVTSPGHYTMELKWYRLWRNRTAGFAQLWEKG